MFFTDREDSLRISNSARDYEFQKLANKAQKADDEPDDTWPWILNDLSEERDPPPASFLPNKKRIKYDETKQASKQLLEVDDSKQDSLSHYHWLSKEKPQHLLKLSQYRQTATFGTITA